MHMRRSTQFILMVFLSTCVLNIGCGKLKDAVAPDRVPEVDRSVFTNNRDDDLFTQAATMPDLAKISMTWLGNGFTRVQGSSGSIPGSHPVYVVSPNTAYAAFTKSKSDGSFSTQIVAPPGSWIIIKYDPLDGVWLYPDVVDDDRPSNVNAAPGVMAQVPFEQSIGDGIPFTFGGSTSPGHVDFYLTGFMTGDFRPGGYVNLLGTASVYVKGEAIDNLRGKSLNLDVYLTPMFDSHGRARIEANQFFSNILTPTGLPIEHWSGPHLSASGIEIGPLEPEGTENSMTAQFDVSLDIPDDVSDGTYGIWLSTSSDLKIGSLGGPRPHVNPFMANHSIPFPPFKIGQPSDPHLIWTLLTDVPSADGSRGTIAQQDASDFQIANRIAIQAHNYIIPRLSKKNSEEITYRLEPYLPMVAHGDRYIPNVPNLSFKFPSGSLTVTITGPDGSLEILGPEPFIAAHTRTPASSGGLLLDNGGGHLAEVFQLHTGSPIFDYQFPMYGEYSIDMVGTIEDIYGNIYEGGGKYTVFVAEPLDIEPATLPMTPLEVGNALNPGITLLPGVPADVEVKVTLLIESDPGNKIEYLVKGVANRFGVFTPSPDSTVIEMTGPGEFLVETTARYIDSEGVLWMASTRWGQVVAPPDSPLIAHGRRGRDNTPMTDVKLWFTSNKDGDAHINIPFATGDILWQTADDAARVIITAQDTEGLVQNAIYAWDQDGKYEVRGDHSEPRPTLEQRARAGELPLTFATRSGLNPALVPEDIVTYGYWYAGIERPGERVREIISDDDVGTGYWRFAEMYGMQPGMGADGDLPNDFKFQFGGAVFRDTTRQLNRYGIYGSLWVMLENDDSGGSRVFPPFQGANGGPSGGPIMTIADQEIDAFAVPLAVKPGTILETGDSFSFAAQLAPTLSGQVNLTITGPDGFSRSISGRANSIGYFYDPASDFVLTTAGLYHVEVNVIFDSPTSAGPMNTPFPTGTVLGATGKGFDFYVVTSGSEAIATLHPSWSTVKGFQKVPLLLSGPKGEAGTIYYTIGMPGFLLKSDVLKVNEGWAKVVYDPKNLSKSFPNIDKRGRQKEKSGLADTVWINVLMETSSGDFHARQFTLQGPDLFVLPQGGRIGSSDTIHESQPDDPGDSVQVDQKARSACRDDEKELYSSGFGSGTNKWEFDPESAWNLVDDSGSKVLMGEGHVHAHLNGDWDEVIWRLRVKLATGTVHLNFHAADNRRYMVSFAPNWTQLVKFSPEQDFLGEAKTDHSSEDWHFVEISLQSDTISIVVDDVPEITTIDSDPLPPGGIWLEVLDGSKVAFDDIYICEPSN